MIDIGMILTVLFALPIVFGALTGLFKGVGRQALRLIFTLVSVVEAFFVTSMASDELIKQMSPEAIVASIGASGMDVSAIEGLPTYFDAWTWMLQLPIRVFTAPVLFVTLFFILNGLNRILCLLIRTCMGIGKPDHEPLSNLFGAIFGAIEGAVIALVLFLPLVAYTNIADNSINVIREKDNGKYTEFVQMYDDYVAPITNHEVVKFVSFCGGQQVIDQYATIEIDGVQTNLIDEATTMVTIGVEFASYNGADYFSGLEQSHKELIYGTIDQIEDSPYLSTVISGMLSGVGRAIDDNVISITLSDSYDAIIDPVIVLFATSDRYNLPEDLRTICDVYFLLTDSGALKAYGTENGEDDVKNALIARDENGKTLMSRVTDRLNQNERTKPLVTTLTEMTLTVLAGEIGGEYDVTQAYDQIKEEFHDVLAVKPDQYETTEEYEAARDSAVNDALTNNGIELDDETVHEIGNYVDEHYGDRDDLTNDDINDILLYYYEISANNQNLEDLEGLE